MEEAARRATKEEEPSFTDYVRSLFSRHCSSFCSPLFFSPVERFVPLESLRAGNTRACEASYLHSDKESVRGRNGAMCAPVVVLLCLLISLSSAQTIGPKIQLAAFLQKEVRHGVVCPSLSLYQHTKSRKFVRALKVSGKEGKRHVKDAFIGASFGS